MSFPLTRRDFLEQASTGFGTVALAALLANEGHAAPAVGRPVGAPMATLPAHMPPRVKNIIFLFMEGGVSQVDSFDYKPDLEKYNGQDPRKAIGKLEKTQFRNIGKVMQSPFQFRQRGESGIWASNLFPHVVGDGGLPGVMDEICVIRSMTSDFPEHTTANYLLHSGIGLQGRPSLGAWITYGLGSHNQELPGYVVLNAGQIPSGGLDMFSSGFLPASYQASIFQARGTPLANVQRNEALAEVQRRKRALARSLNQRVVNRAGSSDALESAIANYELAAKMQVSVPELTDVSTESAATHRLYGIDAKNPHLQTYARECLIARRLVERGVRFVELLIPSISGNDRWDAHGNLLENHRRNATAMDQPIAGLIFDLKQRGLLDETLVLWSGEFGRTPFAQGGKGRDHNEHGFSLWMAGGGVKKGFVYGCTDQWGYRVVDKRLDIHDLHATLLHLLGIDHTRLTYRFSGRDIRLTDVYGRVIQDVLT